MTLSSRQNTKADNEEIVLEIKQERNISVSEQNDVDFKIDKMSTEQNLEFQSIRKDLNEQELKMKELSKLIESLAERESKSNKTIEKLSLDIEENEMSLLKLNENIQVLTEKTDKIAQKLTRHSDLIYDLQEADKKTILTTKNKIDSIFSKQAVMCKVLQQRLSPLDKLLQMLNQNSKSREENLKKIEALENDIFRLSRDIHKIATIQHASHSTVGFIASGSQLDKRRAVQGLYTLSYTTVEHSIGHHFNPTTGGFTAPVDGLYVASLRIKQTGHETVQGWLMHKSGKTASWFGPVETKGDIYVFSNTFVVRMKTGDVLYSQSDSLGIQCRQFSCFLLGN
ncbi:repetitive organellar protein-like [Physella acuta]|uniref:repetitive organellar protein-like n=1 Tax=Physella acuta TaxID=109671 RepID=UPI0027DE1A11|nr:repetitive organellar protein-like [Physella acuta]